MTNSENRAGPRKADPLDIAFDIRSFTGALFLVFGVIVTIVGATASEADIQKSAGMNLSLLVGIIMLAMGVFFIGWVLLRPPLPPETHAVSDDDLPEQMRHHH